VIDDHPELIRPSNFLPRAAFLQAKVQEEGEVLSSALRPSQPYEAPNPSTATHRKRKIKMTATIRAIGTSLLAAAIAPGVGAAQARDRMPAKTPEQACQAQALTSIAREWPNVLKGQFEIILKGNRCLVLLQADSPLFEGKRTASLIDGKTGELLAEFYAPTSGGAWKDSDRGLCSYRGGKFPTGECSWQEYMEKADQM
jgi:hypothetical protein